VFCCDPGGHSGVAWAILNPSVDTERALRERQNAGSTTVNGDARTQVNEIAQLWQSFFRACVRSCLDPGDIYPVFEDFIYNPSTSYGGESAKISTQIIWAFEGFRLGTQYQWQVDHPGRKRIFRPSLVLQPAGQASTYATNDRLKMWDLWVKGREHERSAFRHMALFLKGYQISLRSRTRA
jgi:hypothetical protein